MGKPTALVALFLLVPLSAGCMSALENEAVECAEEHWQVTKIGGSTYLCVTTVTIVPAAPSNPGQPPTAPTVMPISTTVFELRNARIQVRPHSLNEAQKLNGIEWEGVVRLNADAHRGYTPKPFVGNEPSKTWGSWVSRGTGVGVVGYFTKPEDEKVMDTVIVRKIKGKWEAVRGPALGGTWGPDVTFKRVKPSDLP